jgi:MSHA biogenesis protein MshM
LIGLLALAMGYAWWQYQHKLNVVTANVKKVESKAPVVKNAAVATQLEKAKRDLQVAAVNAPIVSDTAIPAPNAGVPVPPTTLPPKSKTISANGTQPATTLTTNLPVQPTRIQASEAETPVTVQRPLVNATEFKTLVDKRLEVTKGLLLSGQPNTITLQIKSLLTDAKLVGEQRKDDQLKAELDRISRQLEIDNIYLYRKNQNGQIYTVILYGGFADRSEALAALKNLPESIKNNKPYLRTFAGIGRDIEQTQ